MKPDFLNRFMDLNGDGEIDIGESFMGFKIMQEVTKEEEDKSKKDEDEE